jgi:hypothetical protein
LRTNCKAFLPSHKNLTVFFYRDLISGEKMVSKNPKLEKKIIELSEICKEQLKKCQVAILLRIYFDQYNSEGSLYDYQRMIPQ